MSHGHSGPARMETGPESSRIPGSYGPHLRAHKHATAHLSVDGSFAAVNTKISQSVPHLHVHVVPRRKGDGLRGFFWPRTKYESDEEREGYARRIVEALR